MNDERDRVMRLEAHGVRQGKTKRSGSQTFAILLLITSERDVYCSGSLRSSCPLALGACITRDDDDYAHLLAHFA